MIAYICQSCGGRLDLNKEEATYNCPNCGNKYDYKYFEGLELLDRAEVCANRNEFDAAVEMYDFLLKKEPSNYDALLGKFLSEHKIRNKDEITVDAVIDSKSTSDYEYYKNASPDDKKEIFSLFEETDSKAKEIRGKSREIESIDTKTKMLEKELKSLDIKIKSLYVKAYDDNHDIVLIHPKERLIRTIGLGILFLVLCVIPAILCIPKEDYQSWAGTFAFLGIGLITTVVFVIIGFVTLHKSIVPLKMLEAEYAKDNKEKLNLKDRKKALEDEIDALKKEISHIIFKVKKVM